MTSSTTRRLGVLLATLTAAATTLAAAPNLPRAAGAPTPEGVVSDDVATYLAGINGSNLRADDSTTTACMGSFNRQSVAYRTDRIVLRAAISDNAARTAVQQAFAAAGASVTPGPVERITFPEAPNGSITPVLSVSFSEDAPGHPPVVAAARNLIANGIPAAPDYALSPTSGPTGMWPDGFPVPTGSLTPARTNVPTPGAGIRIWVYDTGLPVAGEAKRPAATKKLASADVETVDFSNPLDDIADLYFVGHATAIGGVLQVIAPGAEVRVAKITEANGVATDVSAARRMAASLRKAEQNNAWPDIVLGAFGSPACDVTPGVPGGEMVPLGLQMVTEAVDRFNEAVQVMSAGNRDTNRRFYPAAFSFSVAVGAMDTNVEVNNDDSPWSSPSRSGPAADFSNYGTWVDAWAPGVDLPTNHLKGFQFYDSGPELKGKALVSGTSFAAPYVAGLLAEYMAVTGRRADQAWTGLRNTGKTCSAAVGGGRALALTALTASATTQVPASVTAEC